MTRTPLMSPRRNRKAIGAPTWVTMAKGDSLDSIEQIVPDQEVPRGTPIRFTMELNTPVAEAFNLAGAEHIFRPVMPEGVDLIDVHSDGNWTVVVEAESAASSSSIGVVFSTAAVIAFIQAHWVALGLVAIGLVGILLGGIVTAIVILGPAGVIERGIDWTKTATGGAVSLGGVVLIINGLTNNRVGYTIMGAALTAGGGYLAYDGARAKIEE